LPPDPAHPGKHIDPTTGIWPMAEWGYECRRGFVCQDLNPLRRIRELKHRLNGSAFIVAGTGRQLVQCAHTAQVAPPRFCLAEKL
jgi:hypothetical protein